MYLSLTGQSSSYHHLIDSLVLPGPVDPALPMLTSYSKRASINVSLSLANINIFICNTGCPTRYRPRHFFNNSTTNEDIATKFEADLPHCVRSVKEKNVLLFKFRCNIFIGVRIIKEMPGSVASGTLCFMCTQIEDLSSLC
jgi:hypothetical protein